MVGTTANVAASVVYMASLAVRSKPKIPKAALTDGTRTKLLDAAGHVFADFGFRGATVREICARAGVNIALVNYYFGDKLELYTEVLRLSIGASENGIVQMAIRSAAPISPGSPITAA